MSKLHLVAGRRPDGSYESLYLGVSRSQAEAAFRESGEGFAAVLVCKQLVVTRRKLLASALPVPSARKPKPKVEDKKPAGKKSATKKAATKKAATKKAATKKAAETAGALISNAPSARPFDDAEKTES